MVGMVAWMEAHTMKSAPLFLMAVTAADTSEDPAVT